MRHSITLVFFLGLAACYPKSPDYDYSTPEGAVRSFLEAGRVGDSRSVRESVIAAERKLDLHIDYRDIGEYSLASNKRIDNQSAVVMLRTGTVQSPLACVKEQGAWRVSIRGSLACMKQMRQGPPAATPQ